MALAAPNIPGVKEKRIEKLEELLAAVADARDRQAKATKDLQKANKEAKEYAAAHDIPMYRAAGLVIEHQETQDPDPADEYVIKTDAKAKQEAKAKKKAEKAGKG